MRNYQGQFIKGNKEGFQKGNKLGVVNRGKKRSEEQKEKLSNERKGKHFSPKTEFKKGQIIPFSVREKIAKALSGEKHYLWKGGKHFRSLIRRCWKYRQWRSDVFTRDDFTCQWCGLRGGYIEADHYPKMFSTIIDENKIRNVEGALVCEELWNINNGRTLCKKCHNKTKKWQKLK